MIFSELDHRMSVVQRWSVVGTIRKQSIAEHSYNVTIIARRLIKRLINDDDGQGLIDTVTRYALYHDYEETVTGDFPSYMKPHVDPVDVLGRVGVLDDEEVETDAPTDRPLEEQRLIKFIVKCADFIDACQFLRMEISLGNRSVAHHLRHLEYRFRSYTIAAQGEVTADAFRIWDWYNEEVVSGLFGGNGQFTSEIHGFPEE